MRKTGLCSVTFRPLSVGDVIGLAEKNGLNCIEWGGDIHVPPDDLINASRIGELTRNSGLSCDSYGSYFRCDSLQNFKPICAAAKALGASVIRVWAGEKDSEFFSLDEFTKLRDTVKVCADYAADYGQTIAFEYHYGTYCNRPEAVNKLLDAVGKNNLGTYWQPAYWLGDIPEEERIEKNLSAIEHLKESLVNIHVYNWRGFDRFPLSESADEWRRYLKLIPQKCNCLLEFVAGDEVVNFEKDSKTLKELIL